MQLPTRPEYLNPRMVALLIATALIIVATVAAVVIRNGSDTPVTESAAAPAVVEPVEDSELSRIILTERAAERLGIQTEAVHTERVNGAATLVVPYSAVYYAPDGQAWVYTSPEPLGYVRHAITVDRIEGDKAFLTEGPPVDTTVVTVGVPELYGTEFEIGH